MTGNLAEQAEIFASVDADMIVKPDWLTRMLPHLLLDENVALACPSQVSERNYTLDKLYTDYSQTFYNIPPGDPLCQCSIYDENIQEALRDGLGAGRYIGSVYVARRSAFEAIGLCPVNSLTEDLNVTILLNGSGWETIFVSEPLQFGLASESFHICIKQGLSEPPNDV